MRRATAYLRRTVALLALAVAVFTLVWMFRTWTLSDHLQFRDDQAVRLDGREYTAEKGIDVGSRHGVIEISVFTESYMEHGPVGWRFFHWRSDAINTWSPPTPFHMQMADFYEMVLDGVWPPLERRGIAFSLYLASDEAVSLNMPGLPDPFYFKLHLPHWLIAAVAAAVFLLAVRPDWRRRRRRARGLCVRCGYDLRGSPDRCPECGAPSTNKVPPELPKL